MSIHKQAIWRLSIGGSKYVGLIPHELGYFQTHFAGKPMDLDWMPPPIQLLGRSKKLPDFMSWMMGAPVLSERAVRVLRPLLHDHVQFFPFHEVKGRSYYAMNVVRVETGLLDHDRSTLFYTSDRSVLVTIERAVFCTSLPAHLPPIFKLAEHTGSIFVTGQFAQVAVDEQLTGLALVKPGDDLLSLALKRLSGNDVLGIAQ